jgi:FAD dependent oxidoreductase
VSTVQHSHKFKTVMEPAKDIPVVYDVDVLIVGGTTGAVAAAVAAAKQGASVFLAAPRAYLGEDMCATSRLWLKPGEEPSSDLAREIFRNPREQEGLNFSYETDQSATYNKLESMDPPPSLNDKRWSHALNDSVQYIDDVTITAKLPDSVQLKALRMMVFQADEDYAVEEIRIKVSTDNIKWLDSGVIKNAELYKDSYIENALILSSPLNCYAQYVRLEVKKAPKAKRILIGQIQLEPTRVDTAECSTERWLNTTPMQVKRTLDNALLNAKIPFLYDCYATDILEDSEGKPAGIVMTNRAGIQAVKAKVIIDATDRAHVARMAGTEFADYPTGIQTFRRVVIGGKVQTGKNISVRKIPLRFPVGGRPPLLHHGQWSEIIYERNAAMLKEYHELIEYTLKIPMKNASFASFANAEQVARDMTFHPAQVDESEVLFQAGIDPLKGKYTLSGAWPGAANVDLDIFRPMEVPYIFVLGGSASVSQPIAERLMRPLELLKVGQRVGVAAMAEAKVRKDSGNTKIRTKSLPTCINGKAKRHQGGLRVWDTKYIKLRQNEKPLPVIGEYDVVVIGGGTGGASAGVSAARHQAKTLVVENLYGLGGVATTGLIGLYCSGYRKGFTEEMEAGIKKLATDSYIVGKMEWWRREIRKANGDIWFGALSVGAFVESGRVKGAVIVTPQGCGVVLGKVIIDGTGNSEIATAAGAESMFCDSKYFGIQRAGIPRREPGASYINSDWTYIDDADMIDRWTASVLAKKLNIDAYDIVQLIDTRERRRIVGDYILSPLDVVNARTFPDTIGISQGGKLDKHGRPVHPYYQINNFLGGIAYIPYRCLIPKGLDGILVVGLGISAHCDAIPSVRMQPCVQNQGYAAGLAAAMLAQENKATRKIDIKKLHRQLIDKGCLTPDVANHQDSYPFSIEIIKNAVRSLSEEDYAKLGIVMANVELSIPLLRDAYKNTSCAEGKLRSAHVLGMLGDATGTETLIKKIESFKFFDSECIGYYFPNVTWLDSYILGLGYTCDCRAVKPILDKLNLLVATNNKQLSHLQSIALALESLADPDAAKPLAGCLLDAGMDEDAVTSMNESLTKLRAQSGHIALVLARTLYHCGDYQELGKKVLKTYANDVRGPFAQHAREVLLAKS